MILLLLLLLLGWDAVTGAQYYIYSTRIIGVTGWVNDTAYTNTVSISIYRQTIYVSEYKQFVMKMEILLHSVQPIYLILNHVISLYVTTQSATFGNSDGSASISISGGFGLVTLDLEN